IVISFNLAPGEYNAANTTLESELAVIVRLTVNCSAGLMTRCSSCLSTIRSSSLAKLFKYLLLIVLLVLDMTELRFTVEVPSKLENKFEVALERIIREFIEELEFSVTRDILSKSKLTKKQADKFADEVKEGMAKRHGLA
ncbi:unnamed protein product, partial [marine sediment metagenome]